MRNAWAVCKRELGAYFTTPIGYVVLGVYALITGLGFTASFLFFALITQSPATYAYPNIPDFEEDFLSIFLVFCGTMIMFIAPLITMRLFSEERHRGTMELLLTYPLRDREIIAGKYGAALGMLVLMTLTVAVYMIIVGYFVSVEPAVLIFGLLTVVLMGAAFLSLGMFMSSICSNQITAATATYGFSFVFYILGSLAEDLSESNPAPATWPERARDVAGFFYDLYRIFVQEFSLDAHAKEMAQGIVQPYDIAYYVLFIALFLFLTFRALESRKWRA